MSESAAGAIERIASANGAELDSTTKKIRLKTSTVAKMQRFYLLFANDPTAIPKESEVISFMTELAFEHFISSGEIQKKTAEIAK